MPSHFAEFLIWLFSPQTLEAKALLALTGIALWFAVVALIAGGIAYLIFGKESEE